MPVGASFSGQELLPSRQMRTGYSNSRSEGYNRLAKHQGRNAFGFRNPVNQRGRTRWLCTRQYRRASAVNSKLPV